MPLNTFITHFKKICTLCLLQYLALNIVFFFVPHGLYVHAQSTTIKINEPSDLAVKGIPYPFLWEITPQAGKKSYLF